MLMRYYRPHWGVEKYQGEEIHPIGRYCSVLNLCPDILFFKTARLNLCKLLLISTPPVNLTQ
jgi:hypothetical protein